MVPDEEHAFQEGPELDCTVVARSLGLFAGPEAKVEAQLGQVGDVPGPWVGGGGSRGHNGLEDAQGGGVFPLDWGFFNPISFELSVEVIVQADVGLGVRGVSGVG